MDTAHRRMEIISVLSVKGHITSREFAWELGVRNCAKIDLLFWKYMVLWLYGGMTMEERIRIMLPLLDERQRRIFLAAEAKAYGRGGIAAVSRLSGAAPSTIRKGLKEIGCGELIERQDRIRAQGAGRKKLKDSVPDIERHIQEIVDGSTYGNPQKVLSYTTLSLRKIKDILAEKFHIDISFRSVSSILEKLGYSKQSNQKMLQVGEPHPDRNEQFEFINGKAADFLEKGLPVISVDAKKKENIGNFKNNGQEYRHSKEPHKVLDHDFPIPELGKVAPYGVYVLNDNTGFANLGTDHDTAEFAAESILRWWTCIGSQTFPEADKIYITCDNGGSNCSRLHLSKYGLQQLADYTGLEVHVSHFPPGTSKWNKIEHRLFCYITKSWQGQPLVDIETVVNLIAGTTTEKGLKVKCQVDTKKYELKRKVTDEEFEKIQLFPCDILGSWNYVIKPRKQ